MADPIAQAAPKRQRLQRIGQHVVHAEHTTRTDAYGDVAKKTFPKGTWDMIPGVHFMDKNGITRLAKGGWVEVAPGKGTPAPETLKTVNKPERIVRPTENITLTPAPRVEAPVRVNE